MNTGTADMTTTEQLLADALRVVAAGNTDYEDLQEMARDALAAYDAQQAATPAPGMWRTGCCDKDGLVQLAIDTGAVTSIAVGSALPEHAARIVQCVNAHDGLVAALQDAAAALDSVALMGSLQEQALHAAVASLAAAGVHHA